MAWTCETCETVNETQLLTCEVCASPRTVKAIWTCPNCETTNADYNDNCEVCGMEKVEELLHEPGLPAIVHERKAEVMLRDQRGILWEVPGRIRIPDKNWVPVAAPKSGKPVAFDDKFGDTVRRVFENGMAKFKTFSKRKKRKWINRTLMVVGILALNMSASAVWTFMAGIGIFAMLRAMSPSLKESYERFLEPTASDPAKMLPSGEYGYGERYENSHVYPVVALSYSREGDQLISLDNRGTLFRWDVNSGEKKRSANVFDGFPEKVVLGTHGAYAMINGNLEVYDSAARKKQTLRVDMPVSSESALVLSDSGRYLALGSTIGKTGVWNTLNNSHFELKDTAPGNVNTINFFPGDDQLICGTSLGTVLLWSLKGRSVSFQDLRTGVEVISTAVSPSSEFFAAAYTDGEVRVWSYPSFTEQYRFVLEQNEKVSAYQLYAKVIQFVPHSNLFISADQMGTIKIWSLAEDKEPVEITTLSGSSIALTHLAVSKQGNWLASGAEDGRIAMFYLGDYR